MGRTHDHHCRNCHAWVNGYAVDNGKTCGCGRWDGFYDLNHEGCEGGCPERVDCGAALVIDHSPDHWILACVQSEGHISPHTSAIAWPNVRSTG